MGVAWGSKKVAPHEFDGSATTAQTVVAGSANKEFVIVRLAAVTKDANAMRVFHTSNEAGKRIVSGYFGAGGGVAWHYERDTAPVVPTGEDLLVACAGSCNVVVEGFHRSA